MEDDLEFEFESADGVDSDDAQPRKEAGDSKYRLVVQEWSLHQPEASARFVREDSDDGCVVLEMWGAELQVYAPQDADSNFFATTDDEDAGLNAMLTEINDMPHLRTLPEFLTHASRLLNARSDHGAAGLLRNCAQPCGSAHREDEALSEVAPREDALVMDLDDMRRMQGAMIDRVSQKAHVERHAAALLLLHTQWDDEVLLQRLAEDGDALRVAAGVAVDAGAQRRCQQAPPLCSVCFVDEAVTCLPCGHGLCADDWPAFLKCNLDSGTVGGANCLQLRCPGERCPLIVSSHVFERYLSPEDYARYAKLQVLSFANDNPRVVWCPASGCEFCVGYSRRRSTVTCRCGHRFCFSCRLGAHAPAKCSSTRAWTEKVEKMSGVERCAAASKDAKPCPNPGCGVLTHKESGCNYLLCTQCGEKWCWQCGDWGGGPSRRPEPHHVYECNDPVNHEWAKTSLVDLFDNEGRYWFYFDRYSNHLKSLEFAEELCASLPAPALATPHIRYVESNPREGARSYHSIQNYDATGTGAARSMLDSPQAWCAMSDREGEWMQIDLGAVSSVAGVVVQGRGDGAEEWVTRLLVEHGSRLLQPETSAGEFHASTDAGSRVQLLFPSPVQARYLRLTPLAWHNHISMRAGVLVCQRSDAEDEDAGQSWECGECTFQNPRASGACDVCNAPRPKAPKLVGADDKRRQDMLQLFRDAAGLLIECRQVLAWTYVWAFFEGDEVRRQLFEFVQKDLETKTEQLSSMIEKRPTADILRERTKLLDYVSALSGYLENIKEYTVIDPDLATV